MTIRKNAGILAADIMRNEFHKPLISGKANRDKIEEQVTIGILSGALSMFVTQETVDLAID